MEHLIGLSIIAFILISTYLFISKIKRYKKQNIFLQEENNTLKSRIKEVQNYSDKLQDNYSGLVKISDKLSDLNTRTINNWRNTENIKDFVISLLNNTKRIEMAILNSKNKRTKEYKELLENKNFLFTFVSNVLLQFESEIYNVDLLNNYKMLGYKNIITFDFENFVFSEDIVGNLFCSIISPLDKEKIEELHKEEEKNCLELLKEDVEIFVEKLVNPPLPNERLKTAKQRYNKLNSENNLRVLEEQALYH